MSSYIHPTTAREMAEKVQFLLDKEVWITLKYDPPGRQVNGRAGIAYMFTLTDGRRMFVDEPEARYIAEHFRAGDPFWMRKHKVSKGVYGYEIWPGGPEARRGPIESTLGSDASRLERDLARSVDTVRGNGAVLPPAAPTARQPLPAAKYGPPAPAPRSSAWENSADELIQPHGEMRVPRENAAGSSNAPAPAATRSPQQQPAPQSVPGLGDRKPPVAAAVPSQGSAPPRTQLEAALCTAVQACYAAQEYARSIGYAVTFSSEDLRAMAITLVINKAQERGRGAA